MDKLGELVIYIRKKGIRETLARIRSRYFSVLTFVHFQRNLNIPFDGLLLGDDCRVVANDSVLLEKERTFNHDLPREFYIDQTHQGKHFYLLYAQEHLAGVCWVFTVGEYSRFFTFKNQTSCELNYIITLPAFRGNKLSTKFTNFICNELKSLGMEAVYLSISGGNVSSMKTMGNTNFLEFKEVKSVFSWSKKTVI